MTPKTLTLLETDRFLAQLRQEDTTPITWVKGLRNYTMAVLMLDAGLRVGEVTGLLVSDLIVADEPVTSLCVRAEIAKRKRQRIIPLTKRARSALEQMQENCWKSANYFPDYYAFRQKKTQFSMSRRQVERIFRRVSMESIGRTINPHMLRHTFGTKLMRITNSRTVQELLGHKNLSSTQIYTHPNEQDKAKAIEQLE